MARLQLTQADLARLPNVTLAISFATAHGPFHASFTVPPLSTVLLDAKAIDAKNPREQAVQVILIAGSDGYVAALAMAEVAHDYENKTVILAEEMNGKPFGQDHFRLVVPGDKQIRQSSLVV